MWGALIVGEAFASGGKKICSFRWGWKAQSTTSRWQELRRRLALSGTVQVCMARVGGIALVAEEVPTVRAVLRCGVSQWPSGPADGHTRAPPARWPPAAAPPGRPPRCTPAGPGGPTGTMSSHTGRGGGRFEPQIKNPLFYYFSKSERRGYFGSWLGGRRARRGDPLPPPPTALALTSP